EKCDATRAASGDVDERLKQPVHRRVGVNQAFGMPLNTDDKAVSCSFDCLDHTVRGEGGDVKASCDLCQRLMVKTVDLRAVTENFRKQGSRLSVHVMRHVFARKFRVILMTIRVWHKVGD